MDAKLKLGDFELRSFSAADAAFGADLRDYPPRDQIPEKYWRGGTPANKAVSTLFFQGGKLADHGFKLKPGINSGVFHTALRSLLCSFAPQHEHKEAACAWLVDSCCDHEEPVK